MANKGETGILTLYSDVQATAVRWLWYPFIAVGKITLLQGDPGDGKSTMMMNLIAELSKGGTLPDGKIIGMPQRVIYQCSEDGVSDTIKPRLEKCGADCRNVAFINEETYIGLTLDDERIRQAIIEFRPRLVVIDPIQAYLGSDSDLQIAGRARKLMQRLGMWASVYDCAIVLIGHLNKKEGTKGLYRSLGSIDVVAAARSVLQVERDAEKSDIRIVRQIKNSLAPSDGEIKFSITAEQGFKWLECEIKPDPSAEPETPVFESKSEKAAYLIKKLLSGGDMRSREIYMRMSDEGISRRTAENKSKKNNNDRTQYRQRDHHEAIVSREVYNAANHLRASRSYTKKNRPLPVLSVVDDGILRGYVPFDKDWTGFSAEEYREASESVMREKKQDTVEVMNRLDLSGYEVVRAQYFATLQNPAMTIANGKLRFNTACLKKFEDVEYVELLLNSVDRCIAIRPCEKDNPNAIRWGRLKEGRWCASTLGCRGLAKALFDMMEWEEGLKYRFRGQLVGQDDDKLMLFELDEPEMVKVEEIVLPSKEQDEEGKTVKQTIYIFPPEWAGTFGKPITSIAQVGILQQEHYSGNWDVLRPAAEIEEMNTFTADGLNALLHEAEKIMEGWTDTDE